MIKRAFVQPTSEEIKERRCIEKLLYLELILWNMMNLDSHLWKDVIGERQLYYWEQEELYLKN